VYAGGGGGGGGGAAAVSVFCAHALSPIAAATEITTSKLALLTTIFSQAERHDDNNVHIALPFIRLKR
jgi:hypothetical protein